MTEAKQKFQIMALAQAFCALSFAVIFKLSRIRLNPESLMAYNCFSEANTSDTGTIYLIVMILGLMTIGSGNLSDDKLWVVQAWQADENGSFEWKHKATPHQKCCRLDKPYIALSVEYSIYASYLHICQTFVSFIYWPYYLPGHMGNNSSDSVSAFQKWNQANFQINQLCYFFLM